MPWRADASGFASLAICANRKWRVAPGTKRYTPSVAATRMLLRSARPGRKMKPRSARETTPGQLRRQHRAEERIKQAKFRADAAWK
jgi:hypothetical protein